MERGKIIDQLIKVEGLPEKMSDNGWEDLLDTVEELCQDEASLMEARMNAFPSEKKAKEIALEAALKLYVPSTQTADMLLKDAQSIFEWLSK